MKNYSLLVPLALALSACADAPAGLQITSKFTPSATCTAGGATGTTELATGLLNVAAGAGYMLGLNVSSTLAFTEIEVSELPLNSPNENIIYISDVELSYDQPDGEFSIDDDSYSYFASVGGGTFQNAGAQLFVDLIGPEAAQTLQREAGTEPVQLDVTVRVVGKTGAGARVESNGLTFPIYVFNLNTCDAGQEPDPTTGGPCGQPGGQDNYAVTCRPASAPAP
ncbi:hypothetical protein HPC49_33835 [Pyxidicoccus fallax]|uniref:Lipoprotein n=1 Tax=Pyxidicoccus fallax TaxID=394095 RepID=A0A848LWZ5_9BACT|nr:hypothetical protein [Pyxidicoccus fallax]NMO21794.1 hypothetical protein [Pyxidicoccus fallax]NPC83189.1 hypothetical protein [Pyxidicoccus fallax]